MQKILSRDESRIAYVSNNENEADLLENPLSVKKKKGFTYKILHRVFRL